MIETDNCNGNDFKKNWLPQIIVGAVSFSLFMIIHLINVSSRHIAVAFQVPDYNIGIYFSKLYGIRSISVFFGSVLEYIINYYGFAERKSVSFFSFCVIFFVRFAFLMCLYVSDQLSIHGYTILVLDAFFFGIFQMSYFSLVSKHISTAIVFLDLSSLIVTIIQALLDLTMFDEPLMMLKLHAWLSILFTLGSAGGWYYYLFHYKCESKQTESCDSNDKETESPFKCLNFKKYEYRKDMYKHRGKKRFKHHLSNVLYLFVLLIITFFFMNILYPGVLPYGLLDRDKCHLINLLIPVSLLVGSLSIYFMNEYWCVFKRHFATSVHLFLLLLVPLIFIAIYSIGALHIEEFHARSIKGSRTIVLLLTLSLLFCCNILQSLSYVGMANYVKKSGNTPESLAVLTFHNLMANIFRYVSSKMAVGYTTCRVENEYALKVFHPTYRMNPIECTCFWVGESCRRAYKDILNDFKLDIDKYV
ncbi:uncharacterized protein TA10660 [Theileria annulata]|uniref:Uncharacterized protein n=1 Tax=Theileria annulata TaxID=5874 RepID=Q4U931_THEAN|nr:uncharacterized protein TA10660 [Theileria annulata]CAI76672.1 hypothetical protein TA10660 [Theileria annulata]|eukprot:XP_953297.1 hypothetical protein TA10660 [Theileria annulata]